MTGGGESGCVGLGSHALVRVILHLLHLTNQPFKHHHQQLASADGLRQRLCVS